MLLGKKLVKPDGCMSFITPAKWQAKAGALNDAFRKQIVPYMSKITYWPYTNDLFDIVCHGGITWYLIDGNEHEKARLSIRHKYNKVFIPNSDTWYDSKTYSLYGDAINSLIAKVLCGTTHHLCVNKKLGGTYKCKVLHVYSGSLSKLNCVGGIVITHIEIDTSDYLPSDTYVLYSGNEDECEYFRSYIHTKFVRFFLALGMHTQHFNNDGAWRFVPAPEAFDHIFTDKELYTKYGLSADEIKLIESVIKARE